MLKKCLIVGLSTLLLVTGCSGNNTSKSVMEETETAYVTTFENGSKTYSIKSLPFNEISYGDSAFGLKSANFYRSPSDYGYYVFATVELDLSSLSENDIHWLFEDYGEIGSDFTVSAYVTSEKNDLDSKRMTIYKTVYDNEKCLIVFGLTDEYRYDFSDVDFSISINMNEDDKLIDYFWFPDETVPSEDIPSEVVEAVSDYADYLTQ